MTLFAQAAEAADIIAKEAAPETAAQECWLSSLLQKLPGDLCTETTLYAFLVGLAAGILLWIICHICFHNRNLVHAITVEDSEKGKFTITSAALFAFVKNVARNYPDLLLESIRLDETREGLVMTLVNKVQLGTELLPLRKNFRDKLLAELENKLGITSQIREIDIETVDFLDKNATEA